MRKCELYEEGNHCVKTKQVKQDNTHTKLRTNLGLSVN